MKGSIAPTSFSSPFLSPFARLFFSPLLFTPASDGAGLTVAFVSIDVRYVIFAGRYLRAIWCALLSSLPRLNRHHHCDNASTAERVPAPRPRALPLHRRSARRPIDVEAAGGARHWAHARGGAGRGGPPPGARGAPIHRDRPGRQATAACFRRWSWWWR